MWNVDEEIFERMNSPYKIRSSSNKAAINHWRCVTMNFVGQTHFIQIRSISFEDFHMSIWTCQQLVPILTYFLLKYSILVLKENMK